MAKMAQVRPTKTKAISTKWLKNALNSVGASATSTLKSYAPNISEVVSSSVSAAKSVTKSTKSASQTFHSLNNNRYIRLANTAFKNAINDIKAGNIAGHQGMSFGGESEDPFSDGGITFGDEGSDVNINYYNNAGSDEGMITLNESVNRGTELTLKTSKAQMDAYVAVSSAMMYQTSEIGKEIITHLAGIENNLAALVEYHNTNMNKFIESSMAFYDRMGANAERDEYGGGRNVNASDVVAGGFNLSKYKEYVTAQFKKNLDNSEFGLLKSVLDKDMLQMMAENPLSIVMDFGMGAIMPKMISSTLKGMEQTFNTMMPNLLQRLHQWGEEQTGSMFKNITGTIAKSLGISMEKTNYIRKSDVKVDRGPIPFDGETKNAITNIITKELREQTVYLKYIASHFGLNSDAKVKRALGDATFFDYNENEFIKMKDLDKSLVKKIQKGINEGFDRTAFGRTMRQTIASGTGNKDEMEGILTQFYNMMESSGKGYNYFNREVPKEILDGISKFTGSVESLNAFTDMLTKVIKENPSVAMSISQGQMAARNRREQAIEEILKDPGKSGILQSDIFNTRKKRKDLAPGEDPDSVYSIDELLMQYAQGMTRGAKSKKKVKTSMDVISTMRRGEGINKEAMDFTQRIRSIAGSGMKGVGSAIAHGDIQAMYDSVGVMFAESGKAVAESMNENFFRPIKSALFGVKNESGFSEGGMFSSVTNTVKDMTMEVAHQITGKEYVDSKGERHAKNDNSVMGSIKTALTEKFFGKEQVDENGKPTGKKEEGIFSYITNGIKDAFVNWHEALFGENDEKGQKVTRDNIMQMMGDELKKRLPRGMVGGLAGGVAGLASGGLLGAMVGGPIGGVVIGTAVGLASDSSKFRRWLFGDKDIDNGFIPKSVQDYFKKNKNPLIAGAVLGGAKGMLTGGGLLGTLVGGPVAGALMGMATTTVLKSETFHKFLFGDEKNGQLGVINSFKHAFRVLSQKDPNAKKKDEGGFTMSGKMIGMGAVGAAAGMFAGSALSHIGLLGALAGPAGPIGGALLGLGLTIRSQGDKFKEWLFGNKKKKSDEDYKAGLIGQFLNTVQVKLLNPLKNTIGDLATDAAITFKYDILGTLEYAIEPITIAAGKVAKKMLGGATKFFNFIGNQVSDKLVSPIVSVADKFLITPFKTFATGLLKLSYGVAKQAVTFPFRILKSAVDWMTSPIRKVFQAAFHPIRTGKWLLGKLANAIEEKTGWSFDPLRETMTKVKEAAGSAIKKVLLGIIKAPFKAIGAVGRGIAGGVTAAGKAMGLAGDKLAGRTINNRSRNADAELQDIYNQMAASGTLPTNDDGSPIGFDEWREDFLMRNKDWRDELRWDNRAVDKAKARLERNKKKQRSENENFILKHSGGNRWEDTEENRAYIEKKLGKKFKYKWKGDAIDKGQVTDSANMTDEQLSNADPSKMSNEVRQTSILQRILDFLTGKNRKWKKKDQGIDWDNMKDFGSKGLGDLITFMAGKGFNEDDLRKMSGKELTRLFIENGFDINDLAEGGMKRVKERFKDIPGFGDILDKFTGKGYASGTSNAMPGYSIVGENGPEVVHMKGGEEVFPGKLGGLPVYIVGLSKYAQQAFSEASSDASMLPALYGGNEDTNIIGPDGKIINTDKSSASTALAVVSKNFKAREKAMDLATTASEQQSEREAEDDKERKEESHAALLAILENTQKQEEGQSAFRKLWSSIFSKKGLITAGIIGLIAKIVGPDGILNILKTIGSAASWLVKNLGGAVENFIDGTIGAATYQIDQNAYTNGKGFGGEAMEGVNDITQLATGQIGDYILSDEGTFDHRSASKINFLRGRAAKGIRKGRKILEFGQKVVGKVGNKLYNGIYRVGNAYRSVKNFGAGVKRTAGGVADFFKNKFGKVATEVVDAYDVMDAAGNIVASYGDDVAAKALPEVLESASKTATSSNKKLMTKVIDTVIGFFDDIAEKVLGKKASTFASKTIGLVKSVLAKKFSSISAKIAKILGGTAGLAMTGVGLIAKEGIFITLGAINGISGAARLFQVNEKDVDATMKLISAAMGAFTASTPGSIVDVVTELVASTTGVNILNQFACRAYDFVRSEEDSLKLRESQQSFKNEYEQSSNDQIKKTYKELQKAGLLPKDENGNAISEDAFVTGVREGTYAATYDSFQDFNDKENSSILGTVGKGLSKGLAKGLGAAKNFFFGKKQNVLYGHSGSKYVKNKDGTYNIYDTDGKLVAESIDKSYFAQDVEGVEAIKETTEKNIIGKITSIPGLVVNGVKAGASAIGKGASAAISKGLELKDAAMDKVGKAWKWAGNQISKFGKGALNTVKSGFQYFFSRNKKHAYYLSDGSGAFYDDSGQMYDATGNKLDKQISSTELTDLIKMGAVIEGEWEGKTGFEQSLSTFWNNTLDRVKTIGSTITDTAISLKDAAVDVAKNVGKKIANLGKAVVSTGAKVLDYFTSDGPVYFDMDGSYYKANDDGSFDKYSATGSKLTEDGKFSSDEIMAMAESGILTVGEEPSEAAQDVNSAIQTIKEGAKNIAKKFLNGAKSAWDAVTSAAGNIADKVADTASNVGKAVVTGAKRTRDYFLKPVYKTKYVAPDGTYYEATDNGTYTKYNVNGDPISEEGAYSADDIADMASTGTLATVVSVEKSQFFQDAGETFDNLKDTVGGFFKKGWGAVKNIFNALGDGVDDAIALGTEIAEKGLFGTIAEVFTHDKKQGWYDATNGSYYVRNGEKYDHYNINGDLIEKGLDPEPIDQMIELGTLTLHEIKVDSKAKEALEGIFDAASNAFAQAKKTVTSAWDKFRNWLSGGSGAADISTTNAAVVAGPPVPSHITVKVGGNGGGRGYGPSNTPDTVNGYPYVSQEDSRWSNVSYDYNGDRATIGDSGCGPAAMSMAISGITGHNVSPIELARYAQKTGTRDNTGTNWNFVGDVAKDYGLSSSQTYNPSASSIENSLDRGHPVVLSGYSSGANTPYTSAGHYVVAVGRDANGNILVNDPRGTQYSRAYSPQELSRYTGSSWEIGRGGGRGNTLYLRRFGGRGADELNGFPFLMQTDSRWADTMYSITGSSSQTIGTSGCGPTSMAMVLRSFGADVTPVETCQYAIDNGFRTTNSGTSWGFFPSIASKYGLTTESQGMGVSGSAITAALDKKYPVIASMGPPTFTKGGHFIVLSGKDSSGQIVVNDPASKERSQKRYPLSVFTSEGSNFWSFNKAGQGSIGNIANVGSIGGATTATTVDTTTTEGSDFIGKVSGFFGEVANRAMEGLFTGKFNSDYSSYWNGATTTAATPSTTTSGAVSASNLTGGDNAEKIWNFLTTTAGFTKEGAAGLMGNLFEESGLEPTNLQDTFEGSLGMTDASYTKGVDDGSYSNFVKDSAGYGLAQWTYHSRKQQLLDYIKSKGTSIGDLGAQLEFLIQELQSGYPSVYNTLKTASSLQEASNAVLLGYEKPGDQGPKMQAKRAANGEVYYNKFAAGGKGRGGRRPKHKFLDMLAGGFGLGRFLRNKLFGGRGATPGEAREAVVGWMLCLIGRNEYTMGSARTQVMDGIDGYGYGDCSSTCWKVYERATGTQIGTYTGDMYNKGTMIGSTNETVGTYPDEHVMLPGDLVFYYSNTPNASDLMNSIGHVEMYIGNGQLAGHGGGTGPRVHGIQEYTDSRIESGHGTWACIVRYITTDKIGSMTITPPDPSKYKVQNTFTDGKGFSANGANMSEAVSGSANSVGASTTTTTATANTTTNPIDKISGFFSEVGNRAFEGLMTGKFNSDYTSYWSGQTATTTTSTGGSQTVGSTFPTYPDLTEDHKQVIANVIAGETGGESILAARQEASQMANLNEVTYGRQPNDAGIWSTLNSGWYAKSSFGRQATDITKQAVEDVLVQGKRTLPRYVTEHDMFPLDAAIDGHWYNGKSEDRSQYIQHQTTIRQNPSRFDGGGASYTFYDFFGENRDGDVAGYYPQHYEKYKNDVAWGGGYGLSPLATRKQIADAKEAMHIDRQSRPKWQSRGITQGDRTRATIARVRRRKRGGYGAVAVNGGSTTSSNIASGNTSYSNSTLLSILQRAEAAKGAGNDSELFACMIEVLAIIADNTGLSANSLARANQLLATLQGKGTPVVINKGSDITTLPTTLKTAADTKPSRNMQLAQRIAAGK